MGLAIGIGFYKAAIVASALIVFTTVILHRLDNYMLAKSKVLDIYLEFDKSASITAVLEALKSLTVTIDSIEMVKPNYDVNAAIAAIMTLRFKEKRVRLEIVGKICEIEGVSFAEEI
jgi:putative Mg2+ transporter-C (MgtC) family protein